MRAVILMTVLFISTNLFAQRVINKEIPVNGNIVLTKDVVIPKIPRGYTVWLPETGAIDGLVVFMHPRRDTVNSEFIIDYALSNQLAVIYATTENRLEFFFEVESMREIESYIYEVLSDYRIPRNNLLYCGMSLAGTRALKLAIFGQSEQSEYGLRPKAIAVCDSPLDMLRFHKESVKAKILNYNAMSANEGNWVSGYLESNLGGTPKDVSSAYIQYSPYCYAADNYSQLAQLRDMSFRAYSEPDVNWWIDTRRKDYYSMNSVDLAAFINELKILGNENAELIITHDKGYRPDGARHPHSWSIVDEKDLIDWFLNKLN